ncbi:hypothetical protein MRX96_011833 [Rhipicephalus microplus]
MFFLCSSTPPSFLSPDFRSRPRFSGAPDNPMTDSPTTAADKGEHRPARRWAFVTHVGRTRVVRRSEARDPCAPTITLEAVAVVRLRPGRCRSTCALSPLRELGHWGNGYWRESIARPSGSLFQEGTTRVLNACTG